MTPARTAAAVVVAVMAVTAFAAFKDQVGLGVVASGALVLAAVYRGRK